MENIGFNAEGMALNNSIRRQNVALAYNGLRITVVAECDVMTDEQRWQMEQHLHNEQWESNMSNLYTYGEDGFCDGFTNW